MSAALPLSSTDSFLMSADSQALQPSHLENMAAVYQLPAPAQLKGAAPSQQHYALRGQHTGGSWGSQDSDSMGMDCDEMSGLEDNGTPPQSRCSSTSRKVGSSSQLGADARASLSSRMGMGLSMGMMPSLSSGSLASTVSTSTLDGGDMDADTSMPELSQSLGSTTSFELRTPIKPSHHALGGLPPHHDDGAMPRYSFPSAGAGAVARWSKGVTRSPDALAAHHDLTASPDAANYPGLQSRRGSDEAPLHLSQQRQSLSQSLGLHLTAAPAAPSVQQEPQLNGISEEGSSTDTQTPATPAMRRANRPQAPGSAGRLKISLPSLGKSASSSAFFRPNMPQTPGGSAFAGARDGAAHGGVPVSPFEPPTPLCQAAGPDASQSFFPEGVTASSSAPRRTSPVPSQQKRASLPSITPIRSPASRPSLQRNGSVGMSPLSSEFAAAVSMQRDGSSSATTSSSIDSQRSSNLLSSASSSATLLTPPYSPLGAPRSLSDAEQDSPVTELPIADRRVSSAGSASGSSSSAVPKKRSSVLGSSGLARSLSASRPKVAKIKPSPYPLRDEASKLQQPRSPMASPRGTSQVEAEMPRSQPIPVAAAARLAAPMMEKSASAPAHAQTVSAKHLAHRTLHPGFSSAYTFGDELGSGGFGFVVSATRNADGLPVAVKFIWKDKVPTHGWVRDPTLGVVPMEAFVLKVVDHPGVVKFVDLFDDDEFFYLVMELHGTPWKAPGSDDTPTPKAPSSATPKAGSQLAAPSGMPTSAPMQLSKSTPNASQPLASPSFAVFPPGSLTPAPADTLMESASSLSEPAAPAPTAALRPAPMERRSSCDLFECIEQHSRLPEDKARWVFAQVVEAVFHLDRLGITHRDIKDENCVVDADFNVKLIDFGSAVISDPRKPSPYFNRFFGTMTFASSEILQGKPYRAPHAEVWSLGVLLSILLSGECPFADPTAAIRGKISKPKGAWTNDALNLLRGCLEVDPDRRATIAQVRDHPWVHSAWQQRGRARPL